MGIEDKLESRKNKEIDLSFVEHLDRIVKIREKYDNLRVQYKSREQLRTVIKQKDNVYIVK